MIKVLMQKNKPVKNMKKFSLKSLIIDQNKKRKRKVKKVKINLGLFQWVEIDDSLLE